MKKGDQVLCVEHPCAELVGRRGVVIRKVVLDPRAHQPPLYNPNEQCWDVRFDMDTHTMIGHVYAREVRVD